MNRWIVGAYRGSRADKVREIYGVSELGYLMASKRIRCAASVYGRHLPELREIAEPILQKVVEEDTELRWMRGVPEEQAQVEIAELNPEDVEEWTDGSRGNERVAGATRGWGLYLGTMERTRSQLE